MRRVRERRKLLCVGVDLPIDAGTCGRFVHAGYLRCIHCTRRRWWLLKHAPNVAEVAVTAMLEEHAADNDALDGIPVAVPLLEDSATPACAGEAHTTDGGGACSERTDGCATRHGQP